MAHELHHVARRPLDALIHEGLADHFAVELTGLEPPLWVLALSPEETIRLVARAREEYDSPHYSHMAWFFGSDELGIPRWAGYSLGFKLVGDYLARNPSAKASALATEPSATLRPLD